MGRIGIVAGVLGTIAGGIGGYFLAEHARMATGLLGERVLVDYVIASSLPVVGFLVFWGSIHVLIWIWSGFSAQPAERGQGKAADR
jgi:hypothetical protein